MVFLEVVNSLSELVSSDMRYFLVFNKQISYSKSVQNFDPWAGGYEE
jgi:hypothetical protein